MKIIAKRGNQYLFQEENERGRIFDVDSFSWSPLISLQSVLARGYWEEANEKDMKRLDKMKIFEGIPK
jgi:hypothetical protein